MSHRAKEITKVIHDKLLTGTLVIAFPAKRVAKFIADKLLVPVLAAALALYGDFLSEKYKVSENLRLEKYKASENLRLEKYKVSSSVNIYDSNEFMKRAGLVWAKAHEFESLITKLSFLYLKRDMLLPRKNPLFRDLKAEKERSDLNVQIEKQRSVVKDAKKEFYDLVDKNEFHLGNDFSMGVAYFVELTHMLVEGEESAEDFERYAKELDENLSDIERRIDRLDNSIWEIILNIALENLPNIRQDPDADAYLAQDLQLVDYQSQKRSRAEAEESKRKFREATIENIRKNAAAQRKSIKETLEKLRFDYAAARRYSLERPR